MSEMQLQLNITSNATAAEQALTKLKNALTSIRTAVNNGLGLDKAAEGIGKIVSALSTAVPEDSVSKLERVAAAMERMKSMGAVNIRVAAGSVAPLQQINDSMEQAKESADVMAQSVDQVNEAVEKTAPATSESVGALRKFGKSLIEVKDRSRTASSGLANLIGQFWRIAKMRMLRYVIKELAKSIKEGLDNFKQYSKAIGGDYYKAVSSMNNATLRLKNSIGAALAPAIQMLLPIIQRVVNWFISLINIINQFFALLNGQNTWTEALEVDAELFEEMTHNTNNAHKSLKQLLADFDELNIIQSESGSAGKPEYDYTQMFHEVNKFDEKIRAAVKWIKDNIETIKDIALAIGAAIAAWEISAALQGVIGTLLGWATVGIIGVIEFKLASFFDDQFMDSKDPLWLLGNILTTALGANIAAQLIGMLGMGKEAQATAAAIVLLFSATADIKAALGNVDISALSAENIGLATVAALKVGLGTFLMAKAFGQSYMKSGAISIGAMALVLGAELGIKAFLGTVDTGEITKENIEAAVLAGLAVGASAFLFGKTIAGLSAGSSALMATGIAGLVISVELGLMGVVGDMKAKDNKITMQAIADKAGSALAGAGGYFAFQMRRGATLTEAGKGALATAGFILAAELAIKAVIGAVNHEELSSETFIDDLANAGKVALITGAGAYFKAGQMGLELAPKAQLALGAAGFMLSILLTVEAAIGTVKAGEITEDAVKKQAVAGVAAAASGFLVARGLGFLPTAQFAAGLAAAGFVIMVSCGINAVVGAVNAGELTTQSVLNALGAGGGAGLLTAGILYIGGASAAVAAAVGGGVALATGLAILAAIGITLALKDKGGVAWGDYHATEEEIQTYVASQMFKDFDVNVTLKLVDTTVKATLAERIKVGEAAAKLFATMNVLKLGVNDKGTYEKITSQVDELIGQVKTYAESQITLIETGISLIPIVNNAGEDFSEEFLKAGITGWNDVTQYMTGLGEDLAKALEKGTTGELGTDWDTDVVKTLLDKISRITKAVSTAQISGEAGGVLRAGLLDIGGLDKQSVDKVLFLYKDYTDKIKKSYADMYNQEITSYQSLAAYYYERAAIEGDTEAGKNFMKIAKEYEDKAKELAEWMTTGLENAVNSVIAPGREIITNWLSSIIKVPIADTDKSMTGLLNVFSSAMGKNGGNVKKALMEVASNITGVPVEIFDVLDITGWDYLSKDLQEQIVGTFAGVLESDQLKEVLSLLGIDISEAVSARSSEIKNAVDDLKSVYGDSAVPSMVFDTLIDQFGGENYREILKELMDQFGWTTEDIRKSLVSSGLGTERFIELKNYLTEYKKELETPPNAPDTSAFDQGLQTLQESAEAHVAGVRNALNGLNGITIGFSGGIFGGSFRVTMPEMMAGGGFPDAGEMFIAREAGPEMVGRIGSRSAVANNDQIVNGISSGVAEGMGQANEETNTLLLQILNINSQILRKTGFQPSGAMGKVVKQSLTMYERAGG